MTGACCHASPIMTEQDDEADGRIAVGSTAIGLAASYLGLPERRIQRFLADSASSFSALQLCARLSRFTL
jgi:hypothetical protein